MMKFDPFKTATFYLFVSEDQQEDVIEWLWYMNGPTKYSGKESNANGVVMKVCAIVNGTGGHVIS